MASHFSSIGMPTKNKDSFLEYIKKSYENGNHIKTEFGTYTKWYIGNGIELWGQFNKKNEAIGLNPHFSGSARMSVRIEKRVVRPDDTVLDGSFYCWSDPDDNKDSGVYPFVFDVPDMATYNSIKLFQIVTVQLAGFAHEISAYKNDEDYEKSQHQIPKFASESFVPSGLFNTDGNDTLPPQAYSIFTGHILDSKEFTNPFTNCIFYWAKVKTLGGEIDIVIDPEILIGDLIVGGVVSGTYWLTGRIIGDFLKDEEKFSIMNILKRKK
jgi:hypothetical protein